MKIPNFCESDQLAILAELANPLVHESNNFLNNLFLHMALFQEHLPDQLRADCDSVRREGKKLEHLLRQWQSNRRSCLDKEGKIELNQLITEIVAQLCPDDGPPRFTLALFPEPLWLHGRAGKFRRFCQLWLQNAIVLKENCDGRDDFSLMIQTEKTGGRILWQILNVASHASSGAWPDFEDENGSAASLTLAACKALARHLRGNIRAERGAHGQCNLVVEFAQDSRN